MELKVILYFRQLPCIPVSFVSACPEELTATTVLGAGAGAGLVEESYALSFLPCLEGWGPCSCRHVPSCPNRGTGGQAATSYLWLETLSGETALSREHRVAQEVALRGTTPSKEPEGGILGRCLPTRALGSSLARHQLGPTPPPQCALQMWANPVTQVVACSGNGGQDGLGVPSRSTPSSPRE